MLRLMKCCREYGRRGAEVEVIAVVVEEVLATMRAEPIAARKSSRARSSMAKVHWALSASSSLAVHLFVEFMRSLPRVFGSLVLRIGERQRARHWSWTINLPGSSGPGAMINLPKLVVTLGRPGRESAHSPIAR